MRHACSDPLDVVVDTRIHRGLNGGGVNFDLEDLRVCPRNQTGRVGLLHYRRLKNLPKSRAAWSPGVPKPDGWREDLKMNASLSMSPLASCYLDVSGHSHH